MQMKSKIKFTTRFIYCCSFQFQVLCRNFLSATNSKDRPTVDAKNSAKFGANLLIEHWKHWSLITKVTIPSLWDFADPEGEFNKFYSLLGSVFTCRKKNFDCPAPPFNHISGICKNLADTWPAATRVLSRSRERTLGTRLDRRMKKWRQFVFYNNRKVEGTKLSQNARQKCARNFKVYWIWRDQIHNSPRSLIG